MSNVIGSSNNHPCVSCNQYENGCRKGCYALLEYKMFDSVEVNNNKGQRVKQFSRAYLSPSDKKWSKKIGIKTFTLSRKNCHD